MTTTTMAESNPQGGGPRSDVPVVLSEAITAFDSIYSGFLKAGSVAATNLPQARLAKIVTTAVDAGHGYLTASASNGGFVDKATFTAGTSYTLGRVLIK